MIAFIVHAHRLYLLFHWILHQSSFELQKGNFTIRQTKVHANTVPLQLRRDPSQNSNTHKDSQSFGSTGFVQHKNIKKHQTLSVKRHVPFHINLVINKYVEKHFMQTGKQHRKKTTGTRHSTRYHLTTRSRRMTEDMTSCFNKSCHSDAVDHSLN